MITLADALIKIGADDGPLGQAFAGARKKTEGFVSNLGGTIKTLATGAIVTGVGAVATGVLGIGMAATSVSGDVRDATANIAADLGITAAEAQRFGDVASNVWGNNFAGSIEEAGAVVADARKQLGDLADDELQRVTENVFRMGDAFPEAFGDSQATINTAKTLMEQFGLTTDQAFDFMTKGAQEGLDANGDFVDSIGEYAGLFSDAGFSAEDFFGILESGQQGGVLGTDKIADAVKEMGIILAEGGEGVSEAFDQIGLDFEEISGFVSGGDEAWADYFDNIVEGLAGIEDPIERQKAQVAIFGTMAEDLGVSFTDGLSTATDAFANMEGATQRLDVQYSSLSEAVEGYKRKAMLALRPIGDVLLNLANVAMPLVDKAFAWFETGLVPVIERGAEVIQHFFDSFMANLDAGQSPLEAFRNALAEFIPPETMAQIDLVIDFISRFIAKIQEFVTEHAEAIKGALIAIGAVLAGGAIVAGISALIGLLGLLVSPIGLIVVAVGLLGATWAENWGGIQEKWAAVWAVLQPALQDLWSWLQEKVPQALQTLADFWTNTLLPAITAIWEFLTVDMMPVWQLLAEILEVTVGKAIEAVAGIWQNVLKPALDEIVAFVQDNIIPIFNDWATGIGGVQGAIERVVGWLVTLKEKLGNIELPDWMQTNSPSPWEIGLVGVAKAMKELNSTQLPDLKRNLNLLPGPVGLAGVAGGAGGGNVTIQQTFHGTADGPTVRKAARDGVLQALRARGKA